ncbi:MAG: DNA recombination protein RmuC [Rickettsiales bacterium]
MIYALIFGNVIFIITAIFFYYKYSSAIFQNQQINFDMQSVEKENLELKYKIKYLEENLADNKKFKDMYSEQIKSSMLEVNHNMLKQLIEINKTENEQLKNTTNAQINNIATSFKEQFTQVVEKISFITKDFSDSRQAIDIIKKNIFNPIGAGKFTEITLNNILQKSGLIENVDYFLQKHISTINAEESNIRPDAIILLPNNHIMIIDAKAFKSIDDINYDETKNQDLFRRNFLNHLKSLKSKEYDKKIKNHTGDISSSMHIDDDTKVSIIMFLGSENIAMQVLLNQDLLNSCIESNIIPVGPSGMLNILSIYKFYIDNYKKEKNYLLVIVEVEEILNAVAKLTENISYVTQDLNHLNANFGKFIKVFNNQLLSKAESIKNLGFNNYKDNAKHIKVIEKASIDF